MEKSCETCAHVFKNEQGKKTGFAPPNDYLYTLECRRYPPTVVYGKMSFEDGHGSVREVSPTVTRSMWCGEFTPADNTED